MKKLMILLLVGAVLLIPTTPSVAQSRSRYCRYDSVDHAKWTIHEVKLTIACAVRHWSVSGGVSYADYIAARESGYGWFVKNPSSGACGVYQHMPSLWPGRIQLAQHALPRWHLGDSCFNARSNVVVAIRMAHSGGWGPWGG